MKTNTTPCSLVVFDTRTNTYTHYLGKNRTCRVLADMPMPADQLEEFRLDPFAGEDSDDDDGDQLA